MYIKDYILNLLRSHHIHTKDSPDFQHVYNRFYVFHQLTTFFASDSVFIWPWNNFQLKSLQCRGNKLLTKFIWNQIIHIFSILSNFCNQYSFDAICTPLLNKIMLYRSLDDILSKVLWSLNVVFNISGSYGWLSLFEVKFFKQSCEHPDFIVCI